MTFLRVTTQVALVGTLLAGTAGLAGCQSTSKALGLAKITPDEFRVISKAPLVLPPDYALRPPAPGEPRPQELRPESAAREALLGAAAATQRTPGEQLLVSKAGGGKSDPLIRYVIDDEFGDIAHKDKSFADTVMFWKKGSAVSRIAAGADAPAPVDPAAEEARIKSLTGGGPVIIARAKPTKLKLPGL